MCSLAVCPIDPNPCEVHLFAHANSPPGWFKAWKSRCLIKMVLLLLLHHSHTARKLYCVFEIDPLTHGLITPLQDYAQVSQSFYTL